MSYVTQSEINRAKAVGLNLSLANWREIFLAITDEIAREPPAASNVVAAFIGKFRDGGERWRITHPYWEFDVIYDPALARIVLVLRRDPDAQPAVLPNPTPPLKGKAAERILVDV